MRSAREEGGVLRSGVAESVCAVCVEEKGRRVCERATRQGGSVFVRTWKRPVAHCPLSGSRLALALPLPTAPWRVQRRALALALSLPRAPWR